MAGSTTTLSVEFVTQQLGSFLKAFQATEKAYASNARAAASMGRQIAKSGTTATQVQKDAYNAAVKALTADQKSYRARVAGVQQLSAALVALAGVQNGAKLTTQQLAAMFDVFGLGAKKVSDGTQQAARGTSSFLQSLTALLPGGNKVISLAQRLSGLFGGGRGGVGGGFLALAAGASAAGGAFKLLVSPITLVTNALGKLFSWNRIVSVATGVLLRDAIFGAMRAMREATSEVLGFAAALQTLQVRYENLIARELRAADTTLSVRNSLKQAVPQAQALLEWVKQLSLVTPIDAQVIANTLAYAQAMGFGTTQAKSLTETILTFVSAMGLGSEVAERIIFNFGQMIQAGKLTQTELRDLARGALFPLQDVLDEVAKGMGIAGKGLVQLREDAAAGKFDINSFFDAFEKVVARDFPGALQRMGQTFTGAIARMKNAIKVFGGDIFGPVVAQIGRGISAIADKLADPSVRFGMQVIGETLLRSFGAIWDTIKSQLIPALGNLARAFGIADPSALGFAKSLATISGVISVVISALSALIDWIADALVPGFLALTKNMFTWGSNLVTSFAKGMAAGITAIVQVINAIGQIIASAFATHSPPNIAPLIAKWGAEAMTEYIQGWLKGDFSLFNQIADKIESFLRSIPGGIGKDNLGLVPRILGTRKAIVDAINGIRSGMLTVEQAINKVIKAAKSITAEFRTYITALLNVEAAQLLVERASERVAAAQRAVEAASQRVRDAQEEVNDIQERYSDILDELNSQLEEVTDVYDDQIRLAEINAAINSGLLTDEERRRLEMEKRAIEIRAQIRATEAQRDAEVGAAEQVVDAREAEEEAAQAALDLAQAQQDAAQAQLDAAQEQLETAEAMIDFQIKQNELIKEQLALLEQLAKAAATGAGAGATEGFGIPPIKIDPVDPIDFSKVTAAVDSFFLDMQQKVWMFALDLKWRFDTMFKPLTDALSDTKKTWSDTWKELGQNPFMQQSTTFLQQTGKIIGDIFTSAFNTIKDKVTELVGTDGMKKLEIAFAAIAGAGQKLVGVAQFITTIFLTVLTIVVAVIVGIISGLVDAAAFFASLGTNLVTAWDNLIASFSQGGAAILAAVGQFLWAIIQVVFGSFGALGVFIWGFVESIYNFFKDLKYRLLGDPLIVDMMTQMTDVIVGALKTIAEWFVTKFDEIIATLTNAYNTIRDSVLEPIRVWFEETLTKVLQDFVNDPLTALQTYIVEPLTEAFSTFIGEPLTNLYNFITKDLWTGIRTFIDDPLAALSNVFGVDLTGVLNTFVEWVLTPLKEGFDSVWQAVETAVGWVEDLIDTIKNFHIPAWLDNFIKHSEPPLAAGLREVGAAMGDFTQRQLKAFMREVSSLPSGLSDAMSTLALSPSLAMQQNVVAAPALSAGNIDKSIHIEVNPTYKGMQSETQIYHDVVAALGAAVFR